MIIENGFGDGKKALVDVNGRLFTKAVTSSDLENSSKTQGLAFSFATADFINITSVDTESAILYVKNTDPTRNLEIHSFRTCATQVQKWRFYMNDDGGTIISNATAGISHNLNFTSANTANVDIWSGDDSVTRSGGMFVHQHVNDIGHSVHSTDGATILGTNDSITLTCEMAIAGEACALIVGHFITR